MTSGAGGLWGFEGEMTLPFDRLLALTRGPRPPHLPAKRLLRADWPGRAPESRWVGRSPAPAATSCQLEHFPLGDSCAPSTLASSCFSADGTLQADTTTYGAARPSGQRLVSAGLTWSRRPRPGQAVLLLLEAPSSPRRERALAPSSAPRHSESLAGIAGTGPGAEGGLRLRRAWTQPCSLTRRPIPRRGHWPVFSCVKRGRSALPSLPGGCSDCRW